MTKRDTTIDFTPAPYVELEWEETCPVGLRSFRSIGHFWDIETLDHNDYRLSIDHSAPDYEGCDGVQLGPHFKTPEEAMDLARRLAKTISETATPL
jgi:hypothetical protein